MSDEKPVESYLQEARDLISEYAVIRSLPEHPGWGLLLKQLHKQAKETREDVENRLDAVLLNETSDTRQAFLNAKGRLLGLENAIQIYAAIRDAALGAKKMLDSLPTNGVSQ